jgi:alpha-ribazole phosphatase
MTRLWLVRHGPTHSKAFAGWRDIPADLSDTDAMARLNAHLPAGVPVISSDLIRASATADALSLDRPRLPHDSDLREFHFGDWDGLDFAEVSMRWPDLSRRYWEEPGHISPPGGESWVAAAQRIDGAIDRLAQHPEVIVVAHFGAILTQYQRAARITPYEALAQRIDNLSVTCLTLDPPTVHSVNHCP